MKKSAHWGIPWKSEAAAGQGEAPQRAAEGSGGDGDVDVDAVTFAREKLGFEADARQAEILRSRARFGVLACSRQWGKSTVAAVRAVHRAHTQAGSLVVVASPTERQSSEFLEKARGLARRLGVDGKGDGHNRQSVRFPNESRIVALPGTEATVRGYSSATMAIVDEAARVEDSLYLALRPMLSVSGGEMWLLSTPFGRRGFFWEVWERGGEEWARFSATAEECPRIGSEWLDQERGSMTRAWFEQEYMCSFAEEGERMFERGLLDGAWS